MEVKELTKRMDDSEREKVKSSSCTHGKKEPFESHIRFLLVKVPRLFNIPFEPFPAELRNDLLSNLPALRQKIHLGRKG